MPALPNTTFPRSSTQTKLKIFVPAAISNARVKAAGLLSKTAPSPLALIALLRSTVFPSEIEQTASPTSLPSNLIEIWALTITTPAAGAVRLTLRVTVSTRLTGRTFCRTLAESAPGKTTASGASFWAVTAPFAIFAVLTELPASFEPLTAKSRILLRVTAPFEIFDAENGAARQLGPIDREVSDFLARNGTVGQITRPDATEADDIVVGRGGRRCRNGDHERTGKQACGEERADMVCNDKHELVLQQNATPDHGWLLKSQRRLEMKGEGWATRISDIGTPEVRCHAGQRRAKN